MAMHGRDVKEELHRLTSERPDWRDYACRMAYYPLTWLDDHIGLLAFPLVGVVTVVAYEVVSFFFGGR